MWDGICGSLDVGMFLIYLLTFHSVQAFSKQLKNIKKKNYYDNFAKKEEKVMS